jgi:transposase-like protein
LAQGKAFTKEQRAEIIQSLQASLELGYSRNKACEFIGLSPQTLSNWVKEDEALGIKLQSWESAIDTMVMANLRDAIKREGELPDDLKKENSWQWAKRRMKNQGFSERTELTGSDGAELKITFDNSFNDESSR